MFDDHSVTGQSAMTTRDLDRGEQIAHRALVEQAADEHHAQLAAVTCLTAWT